MNPNPDLDAIERKLKALRIEYEKYFNGANDLPPLELQSQVDREIRQLRTLVRSSIDRFRLSGLEAQYNSYSEMFNRRLSAVEEGRATRLRPGAAAPSATDVAAGIRVRGQIAAADAAALYQALYSDSKAQVDPETFRQYLDRQTAMLRERTGCKEVQFRLSTEGGKPKLKAKPLR